MLENPLQTLQRFLTLAEQVRQIQAEITTAVADLLVRYERERRQEKPELPSGE